MVWNPINTFTIGINLVDYKDSFAVIDWFNFKLNKKMSKYILTASYFTMIQLDIIFIACLTIHLWNWTGMLLVFAYACNLRANLVYKPTETPIESFQVE
jgi:hypothetical protein